MQVHFDTLIVGSGLAGLTLALNLANTQKVAIVTKRSLFDSASSWAQGGIAAALSTEDSLEKHIQDTLIAGAGLCDEMITKHVVEQGPAAIQWLISQQVDFTKDAQNETGYHLTREGGHSVRRVIHINDATGQAVQLALIKQAQAHNNISIFENHIAVDLITNKKLLANSLNQPNRCHGAYILDIQSDKIITFSAQNTVLATGGAGKVYLYTTNPDTATGDGIAMGWRAGCRVANMEFMQFDRTCLYHRHAKSFLISEEVRGGVEHPRRPQERRRPRGRSGGAARSRQPAVQGDRRGPRCSLFAEARHEDRGRYGEGPSVHHDLLDSVKE